MADGKSRPGSALNAFALCAVIEMLDHGQTGLVLTLIWAFWNIHSFLDVIGIVPSHEPNGKPGPQAFR